MLTLLRLCNDIGKTVCSLTSPSLQCPRHGRVASTCLVSRQLPVLFHRRTFPRRQRVWSRHLHPFQPISQPISQPIFQPIFHLLSPISHLSSQLLSPTITPHARNQGSFVKPHRITADSIRLGQKAVFDQLRWLTRPPKQSLQWHSALHFVVHSDSNRPPHPQSHRDIESIDNSRAPSCRRRRDTHGDGHHKSAALASPYRGCWTLGDRPLGGQVPAGTVVALDHSKEADALADASSG